MKDRRYTYRFAYFLQSGATILHRRFRPEQSGFTSGHCPASGADDEDIIFDEFLYHLDMAIVVLLFWIVTADHSSGTAKPAGNYRIIQRAVTPAVTAAEEVKGVFGCKARNASLGYIRYIDLCFSVTEVFDSSSDNLFGYLNSFIFAKLNMLMATPNNIAIKNGAFTY